MDREIKLPDLWFLNKRAKFACSICGSDNTEPLSGRRDVDPRYVCKKCNKSFVVPIEEVYKRFEEKSVEESDWICDFDKERPPCPHCGSEEITLNLYQFWKNKSGGFVLRNKHNPIVCYCGDCDKDFEVPVEDCCKKFKIKTVSFDPNRTTMEEDFLSVLID